MRIIEIIISYFFQIDLCVKYGIVRSIFHHFASIAQVSSKLVLGQKSMSYSAIFRIKKELKSTLVLQRETLKRSRSIAFTLSNIFKIQERKKTQGIKKLQTRTSNRIPKLFWSMWVMKSSNEPLPKSNSSPQFHL